MRRGFVKRGKPIADTMRGKAEVVYARMLAAGGLQGDAELDILTKALEQASAQGRQEGFSEAQEWAVEVADGHKGSAQRKRLARGLRLANLPDHAQAEVVAEERGEDIASEVIAREIRALQPTSGESESDG